jgi:hypothetical protein
MLGCGKGSEGQGKAGSSDSLTQNDGEDAK